MIAAFEVLLDVFAVKEHVLELALRVALGLVVEMRRRGIAADAASEQTLGNPSPPQIQFPSSLSDLGKSEIILHIMLIINII